MLNQDLADSPLASHDDLREALFAEERPNDYHEICSRYLGTIRAALQWIREGNGNAAIVQRAEIVAWYFGNPDTSDLSLAELARRYGKTRAAFSAALVKFQAALDLPPGLAQKRMESRKVYSEARTQKLK